MLMMADRFSAIYARFATLTIMFWSLLTIKWPWNRRKSLSDQLSGLLLPFKREEKFESRAQRKNRGHNAQKNRTCFRRVFDRAQTYDQTRNTCKRIFLEDP